MELWENCRPIDYSGVLAMNCGLISNSSKIFQNLYNTETTTLQHIFPTASTLKTVYSINRVKNETHHPFLQLDVLSIHQNYRSFEDCGEENWSWFYCFMICTYLPLLNSREQYTHLLPVPLFKNAENVVWSGYSNIFPFHTWMWVIPILTENCEFRLFPHAAQWGHGVQPERRAMEDELSHRDLCYLGHTRYRYFRYFFSYECVS